MRRVGIVFLGMGMLAVAGCTTTSTDWPGTSGGDDTEDGGNRGDAGGGGPGPDGAATTDASSAPSPGQDAATTPPGMDAGSPPPADDAGPAGDATTPVVDASSPPDAPGTGDDGPVGAAGETGRLVGMTAAHNAVRAAVMTSPALAPMTWSTDVAAYAQAWATQLASNPATCTSPMHRSGSELQAMNYGENLAWYEGRAQEPSTAQQATDGWAAEKACWTYGTIERTEVCDQTCVANLNSDGCGHYTQIVWRDSLLLGCGVATCKNGNSNVDIWICNYSPAGNYVGKAPY